jgi:hypothetical protein
MSITAATRDVLLERGITSVASLTRLSAEASAALLGS